MRKLLSGYISTWKKSFTLRGRASRAEYWTFILINLIVPSIFFLLILLVMIVIIYILTLGISAGADMGVGAGVAMAITGSIYILDEYIITPLSGLFSILITITSLTLTIRRLHDSNKSAWFLLYFLIPVVGVFIVLIALWFLPSTPKENRFGVLHNQ
ncbi:MAG: DUF805 domain-containing protein [SAR324 cluster bacterium]|nr:DUF805 domain-containing protein [SAR324 cluster bacterium]